MAGNTLNNVEFIFSAKDLATPILSKVERNVEAIAKGVAEKLDLIVGGAAKASETIKEFSELLKGEFLSGLKAANKMAGNLVKTMKELSDVSSNIKSHNFTINGNVTGGGGRKSAGSKKRKKSAGAESDEEGVIEALSASESIDILEQMDFEGGLGALLKGEGEFVDKSRVKVDAFIDHLKKARTEFNLTSAELAKILLKDKSLIASLPDDFNAKAVREELGNIIAQLKFIEKSKPKAPKSASSAVGGQQRGQQQAQRAAANLGLRQWREQRLGHDSAGRRLIQLKKIDLQEAAFAHKQQMDNEAVQLRREKLEQQKQRIASKATPRIGSIGKSAKGAGAESVKLPSNKKYNAANAPKTILKQSAASLGSGAGLAGALALSAGIAASFAAIGAAALLVAGILNAIFGPSIQLIMEIVGDAIDNALAPFTLLIGQLAQGLMPQLMKVIAPLTGWLIAMTVAVTGLFTGTSKTLGPDSPLTKGLQDIKKGLTPVIDSLWKMVTTIFPPVIRMVEKGLVVAFKVFAVGIKVMGPLLSLLIDALTAFWDSYIKLVEPTLDFLMNAIGEFADWISGRVEGLNDVLKFSSEDWASIWLTFQEPFVGLIEFFTLGWDGIKFLFESGTDYIADLFNAVDWASIWSAITKPFSEVIDLLSDGWEEMKGIFKLGYDYIAGIFDAISGRIADFISKSETLTKIASAVADFFGIGEKAKTVESSSPMLPGPSTRTTKVAGFASGGLVTKPTMATIGEAGSEAIIPLERDVPVFREMADGLQRIERILMSIDKAAERMQSGTSTSDTEYDDLHAGIGLGGLGMAR